MKEIWEADLENSDNSNLAKIGFIIFLHGTDDMKIKIKNKHHRSKFNLDLSNEKLIEKMSEKRELYFIV
uniref:Uncharacterized protein n=1 Tax=Romanomermis culicivorax TaxID=13658 RepID=A0A915HZC6_ROMCU